MQYVRQRSRCGRASAQGLEQQFSSLAGHENHLGSISNTLVPSRKSESVPLWTFSQVACTLRRNDFSFTFCHFVCLSLSYTHIKCTYTHTRAHQAGSSTQRVSSREHGFSWQQLCPPAASGQEPNCTEEPGRSRGRLFLPPHPPHSHPDCDTKGRPGPEQNEGFHKDQYPTSLQYFSEPHSSKINPKLPMLLVGPMVQIP